MTRRRTTSLPDDPATRYALDVSEGRIIAGPHVRNACKRHLADLERAEAGWATPMGDAVRYDPQAALRVIGFFRDVLTLTGGEHEGKPFEVEPWQAFVLGSLFGWKEGEHRRFRVAFVETGKGSGKTPLAGGIGLYMLMADGEARAEVYSAAADKEQAAILFKDAVAMARASDNIRPKVKFSGGEGREYNIAYLKTGSYFRPVSSENTGRGKSGFRPHCALLDEVHEHPTSAMVEFMRAGTKGRRQALIFMITNSGVDRTSVCYAQHERGVRVASGELDDRSAFAYICAVDEDDDPLADEPDPDLGYPRSWAKANPSIGVTFPPKYLEEQVREARGMPSKESIVRRLNFCQWVDATNPWIDGDLWRACEDEEAEVPPEGRFLGLDLSGKRDLTAVADVGRDADGNAVAELRFWTPKDTLRERENRDRVPYHAWVSAGHLNAVEGRSIDYEYVAREVAHLWEGGGLVGLAFDPYRMEDFQRELDKLGVPNWIYDGPGSDGDGLMLVRHGQGAGGGNSEKSLWMPRSITALEDAVLNGTLRVRKNPVLTWNSASAVVKTDAQENKTWEKRKSTGRIDGIVALSMALGALDGEFEVKGESVYNERGVLTFDA